MRTLPIMLVAFVCVGWSYHARSADNYRKDTRALLETKSADIKACFDNVLKKNEKAGGTVVVRFTVQADTGEKAIAELTRGGCHRLPEVLGVELG